MFIQIKTNHNWCDQSIKMGKKYWQGVRTKLLLPEALLYFPFRCEVIFQSKNKSAWTINTLRSLSILPYH